MDLQQQLETEIIDLQKLIANSQQQDEPKHLIKMYQHLIKTKKEKLKQLLTFSY